MTKMTKKEQIMREKSFREKMKNKRKPRDKQRENKFKQQIIKCRTSRKIVAITKKIILEMKTSTKIDPQVSILSQNLLTINNKKLLTKSQTFL